MVYRLHTQRESRKNNESIADGLALRNQVIQKPFQAKSATSTVGRVVSQYRIALVFGRILRLEVYAVVSGAPRLLSSALHAILGRREDVDVYHDERSE